MFTDLKPLPADPILGLSVLFQADTNPKKVDLGVGIYKDDSGATPIMGSIRTAYTALAENEASKAYVSPMGWPGYTDACMKMVLGEQFAASNSNQLAAIQTPGGCGALRLGFDLIAASNPAATVWVSNPTWANHVPIITAAGLPSKQYDYYDSERGLVDIDAMLNSLKKAKAGDVVLLHACCHNPTGADLSSHGWQKAIELILEKGLFPFIDMAYHGFATGLEEDAQEVRSAFAAIPELLLSYSCSKNFGLYRERAGALIAKGASETASPALATNMAKIARQSYSMPPAHGAALVTTVLNDPVLRSGWETELTSMRRRIITLRRGLDSALATLGTADRLGNVANQNGMFSLLNLSPEQVARLQKEYAIYMPGNGRINIAGLTVNNIPYVAESLNALLN